jgi:F-type H+-transporting ATPase subunit b
MSVDWFTVTAQGINFLVFVFLLRRFLYGPIIKSMDQREAKIVARMDEATRKTGEAESAAAAYRQKLLEMDLQREETLARTREEAGALRLELRQKAREEVSLNRDQWVEAFRQQKDVFLQDLRRRAGQQVYTIARKALADLAGADLNRALVDGFLHRLQALDPAERDHIAEGIRLSGGAVLLRSAFELEPGTRQTITQVLRESFFPEAGPNFEVSPGLISGIELTVHGRQVSWDLEHYLDAMEEGFSRTLEETLAGAPELVTH